MTHEIERAPNSHSDPDAPDKAEAFAIKIIREKFDPENSSTRPFLDEAISRGNSYLVDHPASFRVHSVVASCCMAAADYESKTDSAKTANYLDHGAKEYLKSSELIPYPDNLVLYRSYLNALFKQGKYEEAAENLNNGELRHQNPKLYTALLALTYVLSDNKKGMAQIFDMVNDSTEQQGVNLLIGLAQMDIGRTYEGFTPPKTQDFIRNGFDRIKFIHFLNVLATIFTRQAESSPGATSWAKTITNNKGAFGIGTGDPDDSAHKHQGSQIAAEDRLIDGFDDKSRIPGCCRIFFPIPPNSDADTARKSVKQFLEENQIECMEGEIVHAKAGNQMLPYMNVFATVSDLEELKAVHPECFNMIVPQQKNGGNAEYRPPRGLS